MTLGFLFTISNKKKDRISMINNHLNGLPEDNGESWVSE